MAIKEQWRKKWRWLYRNKENSATILLICKLLCSLHSLFYQLRYYNLKRLSARKLKELGERRPKNAFVFANGPSLGDLDFEKIKKLVDGGDYDLITVNSFASKAMKEYNLKPTMSVFVDPFHYPNGESDSAFTDRAKEDIALVNEKNVMVFVPYRYFKRSLFKNAIPICGYRNLFSKNVTDATKPMGCLSVTAFFALSTAIHLKYENIYICGYDNSYFKTFRVGEENDKFFLDEHFYDKENPVKQHLPSEVYGKTSSVFYNIYSHFKCLEKIAAHKQSDVTIFNVAKETYTDAFERNFDLDIYNS